MVCGYLLWPLLLSPVALLLLRPGAPLAGVAPRLRRLTCLRGLPRLRRLPGLAPLPLLRLALPLLLLAVPVVPLVPVGSPVGVLPALLPAPSPVLLRPALLLLPTAPALLLLLLPVTTASLLPTRVALCKQCTIILNQLNTKLTT